MITTKPGITGLKRIMLIASLGMILAFSQVGIAQLKATQLKIGVVHSELLMRELPQFKSAEAQLAKEMEVWQKERAVWEKQMEKLQQNITDQETALRAGQSTFSDKKKQELQANIDSLRADFSEKLDGQMQMEQERFNQRRAELISGVLEIINAAIEEIGEQNGYDFIIDSSNGTIVYARDPIDLNDQLLRKLKD